MYTVADIILEKTESIKPFLQKHCKQAGALPQVATLHTIYICPSPISCSLFGSSEASS